jgi:predicted ester cyclase
MELLDLVAEGDRVVARFACSATHLGDWRGHPSTGRRFEGVAKLWGTEDTLERFRQLGLSPGTG